MDALSACKLLHRLAEFHMDDGYPLPGDPHDIEEQMIVVALLTELLGREPTDYEVEAAMFP